MTYTLIRQIWNLDYSFDVLQITSTERERERERDVKLMRNIHLQRIPFTININININQQRGCLCVLYSPSSHTVQFSKEKFPKINKYLNPNGILSSKPNKRLDCQAKKLCNNIFRCGNSHPQDQIYLNFCIFFNLKV